MIRNNVICPQCQLQIASYSSDPFILHCLNINYKHIRGRKRKRIVCNFKVSRLRNTWLERAKLEFQRICRFISLFRYFVMIRPPGHEFLRTHLSMCDRDVLDWSNFCREVRIYRLFFSIFKIT